MHEKRVVWVRVGDIGGGVEAREDGGMGEGGRESIGDIGVV